VVLLWFELMHGQTTRPNTFITRTTIYVVVIRPDFGLIRASDRGHFTNGPRVGSHGGRSRCRAKW